MSTERFGIRVREVDPMARRLPVQVLVTYVDRDLPPERAWREILARDVRAPRAT